MRLSFGRLWAIANPSDKSVLNQVAITGKVPLSFDFQASKPKPSQKLLQAIAEFDNNPQD